MITSISKDTEAFTSFDVTARITTILEEAGFAVIRLRTGLIRFAARTEEACRNWLEEEDLNPERFLVTRGPLLAGDAEELARLRQVAVEARAAFSAETWALYRKDYFTGDWARAEAEDFRSFTAGDLGEWPLNCIDWDLAARKQRDAFYTLLAFDGEDYYGQEI